jgi:hypothetical protein
VTAVTDSVTLPPLVTVEGETPIVPGWAGTTATEVVLALDALFPGVLVATTLKVLAALLLTVLAVSVILLVVELPVKFAVGNVQA